MECNTEQEFLQPILEKGFDAFPEGFTLFTVAELLNARHILRTSNMVEFQNQELKNGQDVLAFCPNRESLFRIATAFLSEPDEK